MQRQTKHTQHIIPDVYNSGSNAKKAKQPKDTRGLIKEYITDAVIMRSVLYEGAHQRSTELLDKVTALADGTRDMNLLENLLDYQQQDLRQAYHIPEVMPELTPEQLHASYEQMRSRMEALKKTAVFVTDVKLIEAERARLDHAAMVHDKLIEQMYVLMASLDWK